MNTQQLDITARELAIGYHDDDDRSKTNQDNSMLCRKCNREKSAK